MEVDLGIRLALVELLAAGDELERTGEPAHLEHVQDVVHRGGRGERHADPAVLELGDRLADTGIKQGGVVGGMLLRPRVITGLGLLDAQLDASHGEPANKVLLKILE